MRIRIFGFYFAGSMDLKPKRYHFLCKKSCSRTKCCLSGHERSQNEYIGCGFIEHMSPEFTLSDELRKWTRTSEEYGSKRPKTMAGRNDAAVTTLLPKKKQSRD